MSRADPSHLTLSVNCHLEQPAAGIGRTGQEEEIGGRQQDPFIRPSIPQRVDGNRKTNGTQPAGCRSGESSHGGPHARAALKSWDSQYGVSGALKTLLESSKTREAVGQSTSFCECTMVCHQSLVRKLRRPIVHVVGRK